MSSNSIQYHIWTQPNETEPNQTHRKHKNRGISQCNLVFSIPFIFEMVFSSLSLWFVFVRALSFLRWARTFPWTTIQKSRNWNQQRNSERGRRRGGEGGESVISRMWRIIIEIECIWRMKWTCTILPSLELRYIADAMHGGKSNDTMLKSNVIKMGKRSVTKNHLKVYISTHIFHARYLSLSLFLSFIHTIPFLQNVSASLFSLLSHFGSYRIPTAFSSQASWADKCFTFHWVSLLVWLPVIHQSTRHHCNDHQITKSQI